ncbi:F390 synthetase-related protein [Chromobacterium violaceum]|uniref:Probable coenzyme F390 synthetase n=1 Tax=Chromobacterium violaceum (strain ATCC 12472 / DSM 30191 / JCM 1249 / CCUG 213 / NBRC 12614 / NCIMB 9131 / NCTC 9757 / MK) TaxID=243365 RepID=Q7NV95_CHRVO|nr:F390 synthetase-related protein [Chromobacterium violaceum]AAQ60120.2 probable coenzyme F390 synthetase [Chromobacterium violaceum ATCC 12472]SUX35650.1 putative adenylate-forming enzyme [Chromobacterium violaceum]
MLRLIRILAAYWRARRLHFRDRAALERHQARQMGRFLARLRRRSPYFAKLGALPFAQWPRMDKAAMLAHFDDMNAAGLKLDEVMDAALRAERSRDFSPTLNGHTVGLSSGTSGQRGAFVVSKSEQAQWAGIMLAKALPDGLLAGERVALFLRANSNLYSAVRSRWLTFRFFDLFQPLDGHLPPLSEYAPTILLAPAQVLRALALAQLDGRLRLSPKRAYSIAEVLEPQDRALIEQAFGRVHEIYQATEGFLGSSCEYGTLHLNEEYIHVEPEWLDAEKRRFVPVITDFSRLTQPIVRYRLNDVLQARAEPCPCGRAAMALDAVEGRCDDMLRLPGRDGGELTVFADVMGRALATALPREADYRLRQTGPAELALDADVPAASLPAIRRCLEQTLAGLGVDAEALRWTLSNHVPAMDATRKRRRIVRAFA